MRRYITYVLFCLLVLNIGCSVQEEMTLDMRIADQGVGNPHARHFISILEKQTDERARFEILMAGKTPRYDIMTLQTSSLNGMCYVIPYSETKGNKIDGAVYYPIDYDMMENNRAILHNHLHTPKLVNSDVLNNEIPITERFLYSYDFHQIGMLNDMVVESALKSGMALADTLVPIGDIQNQPTSLNSSSSGGLRITLYYTAYLNSSSVPDPSESGEVVVYALSPETVVNAIMYCLQRWCINPDVINIENMVQTTSRNGYIMMETTILDVLSNYDVQQLMNEVILYLSEITCFTVIFQHEIHPYPSRGDGDSGGSTGGIGGGGSGSGTGGGGETPSDSSYYEPLNDCDHVANSDTVKTITSSLLQKISNVQAMNIGGTQYITLNNYVQTIRNNRTLEHSTTLRQNELNQFLLTPIISGAEVSVDIIPNPQDVVIIHNHPRQTPPSAQDLLQITKYGMQSDSLVASVTYCDSLNIAYAFVITERSKLNAFYNVIKNEIDESGGFKQNFKEDLENNINNISNISNNTKNIYRLVAALEKYDAGIHLIKVDFSLSNMQTTTVYGFRGQEIQNIIFYTPIKCE